MLKTNYADIPGWFWHCVDGMNANHINLIDFTADIDVHSILSVTINRVSDLDLELRLC